MGKIIDLTNLRFGLWTVLRLSPIRTAPKGTQPEWVCRCDCGTERNVSGVNLRWGTSTNCGCAREHRTTHGQARRGLRTPAYRSWKAMHSRCKPVYKQAADYYERGITVCERWYDFAAFMADMGERPEGMTLDRIDNDKGYHPDNCRWANNSTQRRNSRRVLMILYRGETLHLKEAAEMIGVTPPAVLIERSRRGGTIQEAFDRVLARRI